VPTGGALSLARGRLGDKPLKLLFDQNACPVGTPAMDGVFWRHRRLVAVDGTVLWRVSASFTLPVLARLTDGTYLSELRGIALITNLLDPDDAPALELARNYSERWHIELLFRLVKVDLRTPGGILRSRSPKGYAKKSGRCCASTKPCEP